MAAKTTFKVEMKDGSHPEVEGYLAGPGLGVHRALAPDGTVLDGMWNVIHLDSGRRVCGSFKTRKFALKAASEFAPLADWTRTDGSGEFKPIVPQVFAIRNRIFAEEAGIVAINTGVQAAATEPVQDIAGPSEKTLARRDEARPEVTSRGPDHDYPTFF